MAIYHVIKLFQEIEEDFDLRSKLYKCFDQDELMDYLNSRGYFFNTNDIENAVNLMHVQCRTLDDAQILMHKADWLRFLVSGI
jgi:hypothetical protein